MASIRREIAIESDAEEVWAALRDLGAIHRRLTPGVVVDTRLEEGARVVTFASGQVVRELIVDVDDKARRLAYAAVGEPFKHHHASFQVLPEGANRSRLIWITDLLPDQLVAPVSALIDQGVAAMKRTLDRPRGHESSSSDTNPRPGL
jgi:hypothetical protein